MDERDVSQIQYVIGRLRTITRTVQIISFVYTGVYILSLILYLFVSESVCCVLDTLFYTSPLIICLLLVESKILKLCRWHKIACILPLIPQIALLVDSFVVELSEVAVVVNIITSALMLILFVIAAYKVFIANGQ